MLVPTKSMGFVAELVASDADCLLRKRQRHETATPYVSCDYIQWLSYGMPQPRYICCALLGGSGTVRLLRRLPEPIVCARGCNALYLYCSSKLHYRILLTRRFL